MRRQTAVTVYLKSKQLLLFAFARQCDYYIFIPGSGPLAAGDRGVRCRGRRHSPAAAVAVAVQTYMYASARVSSTSLGAVVT